MLNSDFHICLQVTGQRGLKQEISWKLWTAGKGVSKKTTYWPTLLSRMGVHCWYWNVVILTKFSSLAAVEVVILTTFSTTSVENFIKMTYPFPCVFHQSFFYKKLTNIYSDVIMCAMASQITGASIVCSNACSGADQRKHQSSASLAFVRGIPRWPVVPLTKGQ